MTKVTRISKIALDLKERMRLELGNKEEAPHWGGKVTDYLKSVQCNEPDRWDFALIYYCIWKVFVQHKILRMPIAPTLSPIAEWNHLVKTAFLAKTRYYKTDKEIVLLDFRETPAVSEDLREGDIFLLKDNSGIWRSGVIDNVQKDIYTIEGCTTAPGKATGVYNKRRKPEAIQMVIRINIF